MEIKFGVSDRVIVNVLNEVWEKVDCDICDGVGRVIIKNQTFVCPCCSGKKRVNVSVRKVFAEEKIITSITIGKTGIKYQTKDVDGGNSRCCSEEDIVGFVPENWGKES